MGILIATKLSSKWQNFAFLFWKYFEQIFDSNVIIIINLYNFGGNKRDMIISRENIWNEETTSQADNGRKAMACQSSWKKS